jgi:hypothetical protein
MLATIPYTAKITLKRYHAHDLGRHQFYSQGSHTFSAIPYLCKMSNRNSRRGQRLSSATRTWTWEGYESEDEGGLAIVGHPKPFNASIEIKAQVIAARIKLASLNQVAEQTCSLSEEAPVASKKASSGRCQMVAAAELSPAALSASFAHAGEVSA